MSATDGDGWVRCRCGHSHWGLHGAAGVAAVATRSGGPRVLLQLRSPQSHQGGTWGLPGGARDSHEDAVTAALREAHEEVGLGAGDLDAVACLRGTDHGDWSYVYVIALARSGARPRAATFETSALAWVPASPTPPPGTVLHPALARDWPALAGVVRAVCG